MKHTGFFHTILRGDEVTMKYRIHRFGTPERGRWGPPENYDMGSPPEVEILSASVDATGGDITLTEAEIDSLTPDLIEDALA